MNVLVTGSNGQLGSEMRVVSRSSDYRYIFSDVVDLPGVETLKLDITDLEAVRAAVREYEVDAIVNCAAYTMWTRQKQILNYVLCLIPKRLRISRWL